MKITYLGGGSYRTLPIMRTALAQPGMLDGGEISLFDMNPARAETMGRMIMRTPEYAAANCNITWNAPIEAALEGADIVTISFPCGSLVANRLSSMASWKYGFMSSDQLSPTGGFLALYGGPIILRYARLMEQYCPQAWFAIFANPVAVYSALVNNHTQVRALGICGGYANHKYDLTRLTGVEGYRDDFDVDAAGVNHLSFILRGTMGDADLFTSLEPYIGKGWRPPTVNKRYRWLQHHIHFALRKMIEMYRQYGTMIFSTEGDGMAHLYYEEMFERSKREQHHATLAQLRAQQKQGAQRRAEIDAKFRAHLEQKLDDAFWTKKTRQEDGMFGRDDRGITVKLLRALGGLGAEKIAASHPNLGAVDGFTARTVLEYSQYLDPQGLRPEANLYVPAPYHGLISALAEFQTLLADALATEDPRLLAQALYAYPIKQNSRDSRALYRELLKIHRDEMPAALQGAKDYFKG